MFFRYFVFYVYRDADILALTIFLESFSILNGVATIRNLEISPVLADRAEGLEEDVEFMKGCSGLRTVSTVYYKILNFAMVTDNSHPPAHRNHRSLKSNPSPQQDRRLDHGIDRSSQWCEDRGSECSNLKNS